MADERMVQATGNKQVIGWAFTLLIGAVIGLFQYAILDAIKETSATVTTIGNNVSALQAAEAADRRDIDHGGNKIEELQRAVDKDGCQGQLEKLKTKLATRDYALRRERTHAEHEVKALTDVIVNKAVAAP